MQLLECRLSVQLGEKILTLVIQCALAAEHANLLTLCYDSY
jgi:hypothetical protein